MKLKSVAFPNYVPAPAKGGAFNMVKSLEASHSNLGALYDIDLADGVVTIRAVLANGTLSPKYLSVPLTSVSYWLGESEPAKLGSVATEPALMQNYLPPTGPSVESGVAMQAPPAKAKKAKA